MQIAPMRSIGTVALVLAMPGLIAASSTAGEWRDQELRLHPEKGYTLQQTLALHQRFDLATWNSGNDIDFSRFAYLNTSRFFPHAWIPRAGQVAKLESTSDPQIGETKAKTAEGEMTKAMILAIALGAPVGAVLISYGTIDPEISQKVDYVVNWRQNDNSWSSL